MTRVRYYTASTLDGFLATDDHSLDWLFEAEQGEAMEGVFRRFLDDVGVLVMGSHTYEWILAFEKPHEDPGAWERFYGTRPTFVLTHRELTPIPDGDVRFVAGDVGALWPRIAEAAGEKDVWVVGGGDLVGQLADDGRLDEIVLGYAPVTLGSGAPLLPRRLGADRLTLTDVTRSGQFALLTYAVGPATG